MGSLLVRGGGAVIGRIRTLTIGDISLQIVRDGWGRMPPHIVFSGVAGPELARELAGELDADGLLGLPTTCLLVRSGGRLALIDAGYGEIGAQDGDGGELMDTLRSVGVTPDRVDAVVVSHAHADHIAGLVRATADGQGLAFPNATIFVWASEWAFWTSPERLRGLPRELADPARAVLPRLAGAGVVQLLAGELEVLAGVRVRPAPGHTPGHAVVDIESGGQSAMYVGDALFHELNVRRPEWPCVYDLDADAAIAARSRLLERAARQRSIVIASHLAIPGLIDASPVGYRLVPV